MLTTFVLIVLCWFVLVCSLTALSVWHLLQYRLRSAAQTAAITQRLLPPINALPLVEISTLDAWDHGLSIIALLPELAADLKKYQSSLINSPAPIQDSNQAPIAQSIINLTTHAQQVLESSQKSWLLSGLMTPEEWNKYQTLITDFSLLTEAFFEGDQTWLVLFQNSQELRPTGGFMGSFGQFQFDNGQLVAYEIQDIYEPAGQISEHKNPPPGVKEYLSEGQGWKLADANWSPDVPEAMAEVTDFFAKTNRPPITGILIVNLPVVEALLRSIGPLTITDYDIQVTADNFAEVARINRQEFFPGSQQKAHVLSLIFTQLKLKLAQLDFNEIQNLFSLLVTALNERQLLVYHSSPSLLNILHKYGVTGALNLPPRITWQLPATQSCATAPTYFYPVEANVGINKANKGISRQWHLNIEDQQLTATAHFSNYNQTTPNTVQNEATASAKHLGYVNYQRLITSPQLKPVSVTVNSETVPFTTETITIRNQDYQQLSFLLTVPEQAQATVTITMETTKPVTSLVFDKQPGILSIPLQVTFEPFAPQTFELKRSATFCHP